MSAVLAAPVLAAAGRSPDSPDLPTPDEAQRQADQILGQPRFRPPDVPRPLRGVLEWIGDRLEPVGRFLSAVADRIGDAGGSPVGIVFVTVALVAAVAFVGVRTARRRTTAERAERIATAEVSRDPSTLESAAVDAEEHGDLDAALRLRFRAGLLRLDAAGAIRFRPSITSGEVARQVRDDDFRHLAVDFDEVAYGGRAATHRDLDAARERWARLCRAATVGAAR